MSRVWCIYSSRREPGPANLKFGLRTSTWGLTNRPSGGAPRPGDLVLFGENVPNGPRQSLADWQRKTARVTLGEITSAMYRATAPHWPDEVAARAVLYPHRFGFVTFGAADQVSLDPGAGQLDATTIAALRMSGPGNTAYLSTGASVETLASTLQLALDPVTGRLGLAQLVTTSDDDVDPAIGAFVGAGRSSDSELRRAVELHAVEAAKRHMRQLGWTDIQELGKPFDLVCRRDSSEKHVEVKGTTGAGGVVNYTTNEIMHFRNCPHGADLVVVREIEVDRSVAPYKTKGGTLRHIENYTAPGADLRAVAYEGRVEW